MQRAALPDAWSSAHSCLQESFLHTLLLSSAAASCPILSVLLFVIQRLDTFSTPLMPLGIWPSRGAEREYVGGIPGVGNEKHFLLGVLEPGTRERYSLWSAGLPGHPKVNIGTEELGPLTQGRHWSVCLRERPCIGDVVAAGAVGAGAHEVWCCVLASGRRKG